MPTTLEISKLSHNPFTLVPDQKVTVWAGYEELRTQLLDVVESCRSDRVGLSEFTTIHGDYGAGKSHALRYLKYLITEKEQTAFASPCVYLETMKVAPSTNFVALYRKIVEQLVPHIRETANWLAQAVERETKNRLPNGSMEELSKTVDELYNDPNLTPGFPPLGPLLKGVKNDSQEALSLLRGDRLSGQQAMGRYQRYNMMGPIESEYDAGKCLGAYVNLCVKGTSALPEGDAMGENKAFYFFFDELEVVNDFRPQEALSLNQGMRDLINACPESCCFIFGMSGDVRDIYGLLTRPVIRRMSRDPLGIEPLTSKEAVEFLKQVLKGYRADPNDADGYPFHEDALVAISEAAQNKTPSELFRGCRRVLEKSVLSGDLKLGGLIDAQMAKKAL